MVKSVEQDLKQYLAVGFISYVALSVASNILNRKHGYKRVIPKKVLFAKQKKKKRNQ
jgi:hypothetical protein